MGGSSVVIRANSLPRSLRTVMEVTRQSSDLGSSRASTPTERVFAGADPTARPRPAIKRDVVAEAGKTVDIGSSVIEAKPPP